MSGTRATGGSYLTPSRFADTRWQIRSLNDVNGDGRADLLWHHQAAFPAVRRAVAALLAPAPRD